MKKIKILQLCAVDFTVKNMLLPLVDKLEGRGFKVHILCSEGPNTKGFLENNYRVTNIEILRRVSPVRNVISLVKTFLYMRREKFDIVHVHTPVAGIIGRIAARMAGVPLIIYTAHGFYFHDNMTWWKKEIIVLIEKVVGRLFTHIIFTQSMEDSEEAIRRGIISPDRIYHIGNGVDITRFNPGTTAVRAVKRKELAIGPEAGVIGFTGRIVREKGIVELVLAFKSIVEKVPGTVLLIIGDSLSSERDLTAKNEIIGLIEKHGLKDNIVFAGYRSDISELLATVDVFALPSYREGMPRSIIEAMASGKPVVATNIRGCREEVVDGTTGYLVPVRDSDRLAGALLEIILDPQRAMEMGREGRARAEALFDEEKVLEKQIEIIRQWAPANSIS